MPNAESNFSMVAGDFLEVYANDEYYSSLDCVVTCFFIDCAHNIVEFIELIHRILKEMIDFTTNKKNCRITVMEIRPPIFLFPT